MLAFPWGNRTYVLNYADEPHAHTQGKKPLVPVATTERRIRFREIELKPKGEGAAPNAPTVSMTKANTVAKKVKMQMDHVMGTSSGPSRRGRGGRKRGGATKAETRSKGKARAKELLEESSEENVESHFDPAAPDVVDPALAQMDTSES